ncbi:hypothetical protein HOP50_02g11770 [Chloropicon primus]|uniref:PX domain-containing protein n=1 Tax=Chloropicon primus TaxID=1764295 RepID=A0A5B8MET5_9CHLO|nr:hypothetical protein A3770_02p11920 [Chloropicon primus]UPQ97882.1 hypothetical protein HOP50_02g11770 [Chloropicon primus]|eukprot:QDZ18674.1 hypothetical protein A3770_02p11920 [Chloropicon primus]
MVVSRGDGNGYRYEAKIPSWTTGHSQGEDNVVYYVLEVKVYPGATNKGGEVGSSGNESNNGVLVRSVQRRFSDFRRLFDMLCMLYSQEKMMSKQIPEVENSPGFKVEKGGSFARGNASQSEVIGARREALDQWVGLLTADDQLSWSPPFTAFLQVDQAIKEHKSGGQSGLAGFFTRRRRASRSGSVNSTSSASEVSDSQGPPSLRGSSQDQGTASPSVSSSELDGLKAFLASETATKEFLAKRVAELEKELTTVRKERDEAKLEADQNTSSEKMHDLQFELQETMNKAENLEKEKEKEVEARNAVEAKLQETVVELEGNKAALHQAKEHIQSVEREKDVILKNSSADIKTLAREVKRLQKLDGAEKSRVKKLAREIEKLQQSLRNLSVADGDDASRLLKVLREAEVLHSRIQECTIDKLMMDENGSSEGVPGGKDSERVEEVFQLSDSRISCLLAEVQFLTEVDKKQEAQLLEGRQETNEKLRQTLANILIEHAHLQRACNRMARDSIAGKDAPTSSNDKGLTEEAPDMISLI